MQDQMSAKRKLDEAMIVKVVGTSRTLSIVHFTREFVLDSQGGGWTGVLLLADGKATFTQDQCCFVRAALWGPWTGQGALGATHHASYWESCFFSAASASSSC